MQVAVVMHKLVDFATSSPELPLFFSIL
jgi:hypothetical protein